MAGVCLKLEIFNRKNVNVPEEKKRKANGKEKPGRGENKIL